VWTIFCEVNMHVIGFRVLSPFLRKPGLGRQQNLENRMLVFR